MLFLSRAGAEQEQKYYSRIVRQHRAIENQFASGHAASFPVLLDGEGNGEVAAEREGVDPTWSRG